MVYFPRTGHVFMESITEISHYCLQGLKTEERVKALGWFAQSQNLCWGDTSKNDHSEEPLHSEYNKGIGLLGQSGVWCFS